MFINLETFFPVPATPACPPTALPRTRTQPYGSARGEPEYGCLPLSRSPSPSCRTAPCADSTAWPILPFCMVRYGREGEARHFIGGGKSLDHRAKSEGYRSKRGVAACLFLLCSYARVRRKGLQGASVLLSPPLAARTGGNSTLTRERGGQG